MSRSSILVVDDHPINMKLVADLLDMEGYQVFQSVDAEQAIAFLETKLPDLILMDIALPGMDGLELTRKLKSDDRTKGILIVALTSFAMKGDEEKARDAGCDGYITKPINTREFPTLVAHILSSRNQSPLKGE